MLSVREQKLETLGTPRATSNILAYSESTNYLNSLVYTTSYINTRKHIMNSWSWSFCSPHQVQPLYHSPDAADEELKGLEARLMDLADAVQDQGVACGPRETGREVMALVPGPPQPTPS